MSTMKSVGSQAELSVLAKPSQLSNKAFQETVQYSGQHVHKFCVETGLTFPWYSSAKEKPLLPMDFAIVACWKTMIRSILNDPRTGSVDLLRLLHLENRYKLLSERRMKKDVDSFDNTFSVVEITNTPTGKRLTTRGTVNMKAAHGSL
jgi:hypothetical protein